MLTNVEIRSKAREVLNGNIFSREWLYALLLAVIVSFISGVAGATAIGSFFVVGPLGVATAGYFLHLTRNQIKHDNLLDSLECVKKDIVGSLITGLIYSLAVGVGYMLFYIPGIIISCMFGVLFHVRVDNPEMDFMDSIKESYRLMKGHAVQFFMLKLSFIGWIILGTLCLGVGVYWVNAYMNTATAIFYDELIREDRKNRTLG